MSLWTPSGEHRVGDQQSGVAPPANTGQGAGAPPAPDAGGTGGDEDAGADDVVALRRQLAEAPAEVVVANHCYGLFELAAVYLSGSPPSLDQARLAIDALGYLVDGLGERLGEAHAALRDALAQLRLAYVQIAAAQEQQGAGAGNGSEA